MFQPHADLETLIKFYWTNHILQKLSLVRMGNDGRS